MPDGANLDVTDVADRAEAEALVTSGEVDAAIVGDSSSPLGFAIIAESDAPTQLLLTLAQVPPVELLDPDDSNPALRYLVAIGFGIVFLLAASLFGGTIAQSVVEEKQTRVVELLISAIPTRALLAGKVVGNTVLAMGQILILAAIAIVGLTVTGQGEILQGLGAPIAWFAVFFLFGFVLLAALFAAAAAMVSRQEDIGSTTMPLTMLIMAPYFLVIFFNDNPTVLAIMSYIPFSAPGGDADAAVPRRGAVVGADPLARDPDRDVHRRDPGGREDLRELAAAHGRPREAPRGAEGLTSRRRRMPGPARPRHPSPSSLGRPRREYIQAHRVG